MVHGVVDGADAPIPGATVYWDKDDNGIFNTEPSVTTDANGHYLLTVDLSTLAVQPTAFGNYQIDFVGQDEQPQPATSEITTGSIEKIGLGLNEHSWV